MALIKQYAKTGPTEGDYWKIKSLTPTTNGVIVTLYLYENEAAYALNQPPIISKQVTISGSSAALAAMADAVELCEEIVKVQDVFFADAVDV